MLKNERYNKIKIIHDLSKVVWFIEKHCLKDSECNQDCCEKFEQLKKDLEKYIDGLNQKL